MESRLNDTQITANTVIVWSCWLAGVALMVATAAQALDIRVGLLGLPILTFGAMRWIAAMMSDLDRHRRDAFELGRESVRTIHR